MIQAEYQLDTPSLRAIMLSRLRAWIAIAADSRDSGVQCARIYDSAFVCFPATLAWRRVEVMQSVLRDRLSLAEISALADFIPVVNQITVARIPGLVRA